MYTQIITFYVSLVGILTMIFLKQKELTSGKKSIISRLSTRSDVVFNKLFALSHKTVSYMNRRTLIAMLQWVAYHALFHVRKVYVNMKHEALQNPHSKKVIDAVRGRAEIQTQGASFYLRRISSDVKQF